MRDDEQLRAALLDLRSDVATLPMRPPGEVRARGDQRTRRRRAALAGTSAVAVAVVVFGVALTTGAPQTRRSVVPPATSATSTTAATVTPTPTSTPDTTAESGPPPLYAASGSVDPGLFLPAARWAGPDLADGHATRWQAVNNEGTVQVHTCDVDTRPSGDVALAQVADARTAAPLGTQRIRTYASPAAARAAVTDLVDGLRRCQSHLDQVPGNNVQVTVAEDPVLANAFVPYPVAAYRVEVGTLNAGAAGVEWVAVVAAAGGRDVSTLVLNEPPATTQGFTTLRRLLAAAVARLATTPATATTAAPTASPTAASTALVLEPDGLGLLVGPASVRHLTLAAATADQVTNQLAAALGAGTTTPSPDCGAGLRTFSSGGLSVLLKDNRFLGWTLQASTGGTAATARTADGIGLGSTLADLRAARPRVTVSTATLGPEFVEPGGLSGLLTGTSGSSTVTLLRAGQTCSFR